MRVLWSTLAWMVIPALLGETGAAASGRSEESEELAFPTGTFVAVENNWLLLEFHEDGTGFGQDVMFGGTVTFPYATKGNLYTEMTHDTPGRKVPATYYWAFDGEQLTMELWGEDLIEHRNWMYAGNTWVRVEDPVPVVVAAKDMEAGDHIVEGSASLGFIPAAEAGPDILTSLDGVDGTVAAVPIPKCQPIRPDMLKPAE